MEPHPDRLSTTHLHTGTPHNSGGVDGKGKTHVGAGGTIVAAKRHQCATPDACCIRSEYEHFFAVFFLPTGVGFSTPQYRTRYVLTAPFRYMNRPTPSHGIARRFRAHTFAFGIRLFFVTCKAPQAATLSESGRLCP